jgi:hypothetical protein
MGFVRKLTGASSMKANAAAQEVAIRKAAEDQSKQLIEAARMASEQQRIAAEREAAAQVIQRQQHVVGTADVALDAGGTPLAEIKKRRAVFKFGASPGVQL